MSVFDSWPGLFDVGSVVLDKIFKMFAQDTRRLMSRDGQPQGELKIEHLFFFKII